MIKGGREGLNEGWRSDSGIERGWAGARERGSDVGRGNYGEKDGRSS